MRWQPSCHRAEFRLPIAFETSRKMPGNLVATAIGRPRRATWNPRQRYCHWQPGCQRCGGQTTRTPRCRLSLMAPIFLASSCVE